MTKDKWREIQKFENYRKSFNIGKGGKFQIFDKNVAGKFKFLHWTKTFKIVKDIKLAEKIKKTGIFRQINARNYLIYFDYFFLQVYDFRSITDSVFTLFRMILGDFNFKAIESASTFLGPVYFLSYIFFVFFVLLVKKDLSIFEIAFKGFFSEHVFGYYQ